MVLLRVSLFFRINLLFYFLFFFFLFFCFLFLRDSVSLYSPGCPGTHFVDRAGLELRNLPASASQVLGLKACATTTQLEHPLLKCVLRLMIQLARGTEKTINWTSLKLRMMGQREGSEVKSTGYAGRAVVAHALNPSTREAEAGGFLSSRPARSTK